MIVAGDQVPLIPFCEVSGSAGAVLFWHSGPMPAKVGISGAVTVISKVVGTAHCPVAGVKV